MRSYVMTTGVLFALLVLVHLWRVFAEGTRTLDPFFIGITILAAVIAGWAFRLVRASAPGA